MSGKIRVYELARELGIANKEVIALCNDLGIGVKSHSNSVVPAQADRVRKKAEEAGLVKSGGEAESAPEPAAKTAPKKAAISTKKPPPKKITTKPDGPLKPIKEVKPATSPPAGSVVSSGGRRGTGPSRITTPPPSAIRQPAAAPQAAAPAPKAKPKPKPIKPVKQKPEPEKTQAKAAPGSGSKPIPPPPQRKIPPPPQNRGGVRPNNTGGGGGYRGSSSPGGRPGGGPGGFNRGPGGGPGGFNRGPGGGPGGRGRPGGGRRKKKGRRKRTEQELQPMDAPAFTSEDAPVPEGVVVIERASSPQDLGPKLNRTAADVVRFLLTNGDMVTATQSLSDEMIELFAADVGAEVRLVDPGEEQEEELQKMLEVDGEEVEFDLVSRPPVITVMGHVDHGKTKLLDYIRSANVVDGEAGGITQHIGAYQIDHNGEKITFLDTPGHEAFTAMRARGATATDVVILVVAADDGVMPQTLEALDHAKAAEVPIIVAINKIDREGADPQRVMAQLAERDLVPEDWGGETIMCEVSALQGLGIEKLMDSILLVSEVEDLKAPEEGSATGVVLESHLDVGRGPVATVLVQEGTLNTSEPMVTGSSWGRIRALVTDRGETVTSAGPSTPVQVLGLSEVATAGDKFSVAPSEKVASKVADTRSHYQRLSSLGRDASSSGGGAKLEDIFNQIQSGEAATLNLVVKADVNGSLEAVCDSLKKLETSEVKLSFVLRGVGGITENDVQLAAASNATILGFNVRPDRKARDLAAIESVEIRNYEIIYKLIEDIQAAMTGMLSPEFEEVVTGEAEVREIFRVPKIGAIAGCMVQNGVITRGSKVRFLREGKIIWKGDVNSLKRFKEDATEVKAGFECGIGLSDFQDLKEGDIIETYKVEEIARTLEESK